MPYRTSRETQQKKDEKRQHILTCAAHVFAARGYNDTSVRDIISEADISIGSFYFYFKNKHELFEELRQNAISMLFNVFTTTIQEERPVFERVGRAIVNVLKAIETHAERAYLVMVVSMEVDPLSGNAVRDTVGTFIEYNVEQFAAFNADGGIHVPDPRIAAAATAGAVYYLVMDWLQGDRQRRLTDDALPLTLFTLNGLRAAYTEEDVKECIRKAMEED